MYKSDYVTAVILAAGCGKRMGKGKNKLLLEISGKSILSYTVKKFCDNPFVDEIILVCADGDKAFVTKIAQDEIKDKEFKIIKGGKERQDSSYNGVMASKEGIVMIHDGARPFCSDKMIEELLEATYDHRAAAPFLEVTDTVKLTQDGFIEKTIDRNSLVRIQTPQVFYKEELEKAHENAREKGISVTDDCMLFEIMDKKIKLVEGSGDNIKITTPEDLVRAEKMVKKF